MATFNGVTLPRYMVVKMQGHGPLFYWQPGKGLVRQGWKTVRLSDDLATAIQEAEALNAKVDQVRGGQPIRATNRHGTLPWLIERYKESPEYDGLRDSRKERLEYDLRRLLRWSAERGDPPARTVSLLDVQKLWSEMKHTPSAVRNVLGAGRLLWNYADGLDEEIVSTNPFKKVLTKIKKTPPRQLVWQPEQIEAVIRMALTAGPWGRPWGAQPGHRPDVFAPRPSIALAILIAANTAQRPGDVLAIMRSQYDGEFITLTQSKTGASVIIPATAQLKRALDDENRPRTGVGPRDRTGRAFRIDRSAGSSEDEGPWRDTDPTASRSSVRSPRSSSLARPCMAWPSAMTSRAT